MANRFGALRITALKAKGIPNTQTFGEQDPYIKMKLNTQDGDKGFQRSATHEDGGTSPTWNHEFCLKTLEGNERWVSIQVWDEETLRDNRICWLDLDINEACELGLAGKEKWFTGNKKSGGGMTDGDLKGGDLLLAFKFSPGPNDPATKKRLQEEAETKQAEEEAAQKAAEEAARLAAEEAAAQEAQAAAAAALAAAQAMAEEERTKAEEAARAAEEALRLAREEAERQRKAAEEAARIAAEEAEARRKAEEERARMLAEQEAARQAAIAAEAAAAEQRRLDAERRAAEREAQRKAAEEAEAARRAAEEKAAEDAKPKDTLHQDVPMGESACIKSADGRFTAVLQGDGNFVIYSPGACWASGSYKKGASPRRLIMQGDGNLVIYDANNHPTWASGSNGRGSAPYKVAMQNDRNLVIYDANNHPIWASGTNI